jgi:uncharacterized membrane protein YfcA
VHASGWDLVAAFAAGLVAGVVNAIAGGGSVISFPALLWIGVRPVLASATNTVAMWPAQIAGAFGFRRDLRGMRPWWLALIAPTVVGGVAGAYLLLRTSNHLFDLLAPGLLLLATVLLWIQQPLSARLRRRAGEGSPRGEVHRPSARWWFLATAGLLAVATYGGFFGAGQSIVILAVLGLAGMEDFHQMNGLKNILSACINGVAAIYFIAKGILPWNLVLTMASGAALGGFSGATLAHRLGRERVRRVVIVIGLVATLVLLVRLDT